MKIGAFKKRDLVAAVLAAGLSVFATQGAEPSPGPYNIAAYASDGVGVNSRLLVFPLDGKGFNIPLPLTLRWIVYGPDGRSLYASAFERSGANSITTKPGLLKIELDPVRITTLPGLDAFDVIDRFAVSRAEDKVVFGATRLRGSPGETCGIFELSLVDGSVRSVLPASNCLGGDPREILRLPPAEVVARFGSARRTVLDLSPTGATALIDAFRVEGRLSSLDLATGTMTPVGRSFWKGSYSPNGKWIAALEIGSAGIPKTILIDAKDFSRRRDFGGSMDAEVVWSPDSRFILHTVSRPACPSRNPLALEILDVQTGKRSAIKDSVCNAGSSSNIGWLSSDIRR